MTTDLRVTLKQKLPALKRLFVKNRRVMGVWLFGSQAEGTATAQSDIDLAVLFDRELTWGEQMDFETAIGEILGTQDVDVVNLARANLRLRFRAVAGQIVYERDFARVADFVEETLIEYRDFEPRAQAMLRDYFATL